MEFLTYYILVHLKYLKRAKKLGNILVVSVTNDNFVNKDQADQLLFKTDLSFLNEISFINYTSNNETSRNNKI